MDDFTKDELTELMQGLLWADMNIPPGKRNHKLQNKVHKMIERHENPCRHEFKREILQIDACDKCSSFKFVFNGVRYE